MTAELLDVERLARALHETTNLSHRTRFYFVGDGDERGSCACQVDAAQVAAEYARLDPRSPSEVYDNAETRDASPRDIR